MSPNEIKNRIVAKYGPMVEVTDLTGTQDHYKVSVISDQFKGLPLMKQHREIMDLFDSELKSGEVHALTIQTSTQTKLENI